MSLRKETTDLLAKKTANYALPDDEQPGKVLLIICYRMSERLLKLSICSSKFFYR